MRTEHDITTHDEPVRTTAADTVRERRWDMAPGQIVSLIVGVGFVALGLVAVLRAGFDGSLAEPVVDVLGFTHTAWLGLAEIGLGLLLMLAGSTMAGRSLSVLLGALMVIAGVLVVAVPEDLPGELGLEKDFGMPLIMVGAIVALAALVLPAWRTHRVDREVVDLH
jgi:hypothetical protein